ncbi:hypothetical protein, partial [Halococcus dombrowskii]|uniref:hypothetical protein n=1 Tax=Halococcus dombrowskii TaxID=179637 RepID=UPI003CD07D5D
RYSEERNQNHVQRHLRTDCAKHIRLLFRTVGIDDDLHLNTFVPFFVFVGSCHDLLVLTPDGR